MADSGNQRVFEGQPPEVLELVSRCQGGDREALGAFYRAYRNDVARTLYRVLGPHSDLEDVLQEVFIEVFKSLPRFRGDSKLSTWLYRVCFNVALQRLRKRRRQAEVPLPEGDKMPARYERSDATPQRTLETQERMATVYRILDQLAPKKRLVFILHEIEGHEPKEIASMVGAPVLTVRTRLHYARKEFFARAACESVFDLARPGSAA